MMMMLIAYKIKQNSTTLWLFGSVCFMFGVTFAMMMGLILRGLGYI